MILNLIQNFLNFFLGNFLIVTNFNKGLMVSSILALGFITIFYLFYDSIKEFFNDFFEGKGHLIVIKGKKIFGNDLVFDVFNYRFKFLPVSPKYKAQIFYRNPTPIRVQLFKNSYFNYFTGYFLSPEGQFEFELPCQLLFFEVIGVLPCTSVGVYGSKALEGLMLGSKYRDQLLYEDLKKGIHQKIDKLNLNFQASRSSGEVDSELALDSQKNLQEVLKIFKEEVMDIKIKIKPTVKITEITEKTKSFTIRRVIKGLGSSYFQLVLSKKDQTKDHLVGFGAIKNGKVIPFKDKQKHSQFLKKLEQTKLTLKAENFLAFYFYNWFNPRILNPSIDLELIKTEPVTFDFKTSPLLSMGVPADLQKSSFESKSSKDILEDHSDAEDGWDALGQRLIPEVRGKSSEGFSEHKGQELGQLLTDSFESEEDFILT